jgi:glutamate/tyrosine decarboxylase-like PLP-dependent enzyme
VGVDKASYDGVLARVAEHTDNWLGSLADRPMGPSANADEMLARFSQPLPAGPTAPADVIDELVRLAEPGLMAIPAGRFFGWVMGGTLPAALGADWLVSAWDQNAGMRYATPAVVAAEETAGAWLLDLLELPATADVGFVTGATAGNFTCLAAARNAALGRIGWDVEREGLIGAPPIRVLVGAESHTSVDLALRYLGLGAAERVAADDQGRIRVDALAETLAAGPADGPVIVGLQAGNLHSGAFDPMVEAIDVAHRHGAWVHVDGAFGLWAAAAPALRHLAAGMGAADSWATDAHKTLNVPYDCGLAFVADPAPLHASMGVSASYLITEGSHADPFDRTPEMSRRARGVPVWAALRSLGRQGVADLVEGLARNARELAAAIGEIDGATVLNDVVYTQVCLSFGDDARTAAVTDHVIKDGTTWMSGSRWQGQQVLRISVSNWTTESEDISRSVDAIARAVAATAG